MKGLGVKNEIVISHIKGLGVKKWKCIGVKNEIVINQIKGLGVKTKV